MNKHIILNALRRELDYVMWEYQYDRAEAAYYWDLSDKSRPIETGLYYYHYKTYKNRMQNSKKKLNKIRDTISAVKKLP